MSVINYTSALPQDSRICTWHGPKLISHEFFLISANCLAVLESLGGSLNMDEAVWSDPETFRPERWLEQPDAPLFTYGLGYRMCAGSLLANREMYLIFMRMLNSF